MGGGVVFELIRFSSASICPGVVSVSAQVAISIAALGADALAHSASNIASNSAPLSTPGSVQLAGCTCETDPPVNEERPNVERKVLQSLSAKTSVSSITTIVCPWPEMPAENSGLRL